MGIGEWGVGIGEWGVGISEWGLVNRHLPKIKSLAGISLPYKSFFRCLMGNREKRDTFNMGSLGEKVRGLYSC